MLGVRGDQGAGSLACRFGRQHGGALTEGGQRHQATACLRLVGGALELGGDVLVQARGCLSPVPGTAIRVDVRVGRLRQSTVDATALVR